MGLAFIVFLFVVALIVGSYYAITTLPGMMAQRELDRRLKDVSFTDSSGEVVESSVLQKIVEGPMPVVEQVRQGVAAGQGIVPADRTVGRADRPAG
jgi:hypothetical protein